ncbi:unnamed protein product [Arabidopsis lyrata]|nr:unnamed protein product [Arabidopsis lyrata]
MARVRDPKDITVEEPGEKYPSSGASNGYDVAVSVLTEASSDAAVKVLIEASDASELDRTEDPVEGLKGTEAVEEMEEVADKEEKEEVRNSEDVDGEVEVSNAIGGECEAEVSISIDVDEEERHQDDARGERGSADEEVKRNIDAEDDDDSQPLPPENMVFGPTEYIKVYGDGERVLVCGEWSAYKVFYERARVVMRTVNLQEFFDHGEYAHEDSIYMHFLLKCFKYGNPTSKYMKSLRFLTQKGHSQEAIDCLGESADHSIFGHYAYGLFLICCGAVEDGK